MRVPRRSYSIGLIAVVFLLALVYVTFTSRPTALDARESAAATAECQRAVREDVPAARFPFAATVADLPNGELHLSGVVDTGDEDGAVRRNYDCFLTAGASPGEFATDSVVVWQSH